MTRKKRETVNSREDIHMFPYQAKENRLVKNSILPTESELKLSESYLVKVADPMLELKVKVININSNAGHEILQCREKRHARKAEQKEEQKPYIVFLSMFWN